MKGKVYLVGAGPGDPDLLTVRAVRLLGSADAVLHDELVTPAILRLANPAAQLHNVGKRCGKKKITQEEVNFRMVALAAAGQRVVRLKGGDPLIFGRAGEEMEALEAAEIPYEIVPGITAALGAAAAAGIALTHRRGPAAVTFLAGHRAANSEGNGWQDYVRGGATLAIYMPGHSYEHIARKLRSAGVRGETPCILVSQATRRNQQVHLTTVKQLLAAPRLPSPSILIVGEGVGLAAMQGERFLTSAMEQLLLQATVLNQPMGA